MSNYGTILMIMNYLSCKVTAVVLQGTSNVPHVGEKRPKEGQKEQARAECVGMP